MAKNITERLNEAKGLNQSNPNSEAFEDYNGVMGSQVRLADKGPGASEVTVGGAEILDGTGSKLLDEQFRL